MNAPLIPREAAESDARVIARIYNESILAVDSTMIDRSIHEEEILAQMRSFADNERYFVLERGREIIGWGVVKRFGEGPAYAYTGETSIFLRRSETRKGYGTVLNNYLLEQCDALGFHHLVARIWASNQASVEYHKRFGYELVGIQHEIGFMQNKWQDIALMQRIVEGPPPTHDSHLAPRTSHLQPYSPRGGYRFAGEIYAPNADLLAQFMKESAERGYHHLVAWEREANQDMYLASGFKLVGVQNEICVGATGWEDRVVLEWVSAE